MNYSKTYCNPIPLPNYPRGMASKYRDLAYLNVGWLNSGEAKDFRETADPAVLYEDGCWYLYPSCGMVWVSKDFRTWKHFRMNIEEVGYAPTIVKHKQHYLITACYEGIMYRSNSPLGPWENLGRVLDIKGESLHLSDPMLFSDDDQRLFCYFGCGGPGILGTELDPEDPTRAISPVKLLFPFNPEHVWERHGEFNEDTSASCVEGAWMFKANGRYYLTYAAPGTEYSTYAMGCYYSDQSPLGPFIYQKHNPIITQKTGLIRGPGHGSIVRGPNDTIWAFYTCVACRDHYFERRIGFDAGGINEKGELYFNGASQTPQWGPGVNEHSERGNDAGLLPVSVAKFSKASSQLPGRGTSCAIDNNLRTWWEASPEDKNPWVELNLKGQFDISALRIIWAEPNLNYETTPPGPWKYIIEAREKEMDTWQVLVDKSENDVDTLIDYHTFATMRAKFIRVRIVGGPAGMHAGITEFTVFGKGTPIPPDAPYGKWPR